MAGGRPDRSADRTARLGYAPSRPRLRCGDGLLLAEDCADDVASGLATSGAAGIAVTAASS